ncbi:hypothetical protein PVK06_024177 [Gossypium arboreum]|uniref:Uncharacterized protein n=1 Tax=Gossypium arboreum TaxID=29729 RepID=A0ABR0PDB7_GOSAR|nr:hypothetical protein PVK06_024177 [Gossypium arboreum]
MDVSNIHKDRSGFQDYASIVERSSNSGVSRATKKVRTRPNLSPEKDLAVDGNGQKIQGSELPNASYKSTLMGALLDPV